MHSVLTSVMKKFYNRFFLNFKLLCKITTPLTIWTLIKKLEHTFDLNFNKFFYSILIYQPEWFTSILAVPEKQPCRIIQRVKCRLSFKLVFSAVLLVSMNEHIINSFACVYRLIKRVKYIYSIYWIYSDSWF